MEAVVLRCKWSIEQGPWSLELEGFVFRVEYRKGKYGMEGLWIDGSGIWGFGWGGLGGEVKVCY